MDDLISRQAVLDLIADYDLSMGQVVKGIHNLPSVIPQPEEHTEERTEMHEYDLEQIIKDTIKEYIDKDCDDVTELLLALSKDLCERIRKEC